MRGNRDTDTHPERKREREKEPLHNSCTQTKYTAIYLRFMDGKWADSHLRYKLEKATSAYGFMASSVTESMKWMGKG